MPARVILQDFTGVPCVVDLAAMRDAVAEMGGDPSRINPLVPADLVIDHSRAGRPVRLGAAFLINVEREYERNGERYALLRWAQQAFDNFRVVPPGTGIVHQVNLEFLADVVTARPGADGELVAFPDTLVGTDSHTTMINGLGVRRLGRRRDRGRGRAARPAALPADADRGRLPPRRRACRRRDRHRPRAVRDRDAPRATAWSASSSSSTARACRRLGLADRATISNMSPEFGATATLFPIDDETLRYLRMTGRPAEAVARVEAYAKAQGLFRTDASAEPRFNESLSLDLGERRAVGRRAARPQDRVPLTDLRDSSAPPSPTASTPTPTGRRTSTAPRPHRAGRRRGERGVVPGERPAVVYARPGGGRGASPDAPRHAPHADAAPTRTTAPCEVDLDGKPFKMRSGSVVIAAITSCTNTSNPSVMVAAGLLARNAVARGLRTPPWVKTSLAPGSRAVTDYLAGAGLMDPLEQLRLRPGRLRLHDLHRQLGPAGRARSPRRSRRTSWSAVAVLSGNRNFEGRIHPLARASYLASPPLVVAFALAGRIDIDLTTEPLGHRRRRQAGLPRPSCGPRPRRWRRSWPEQVRSEVFTRNYASVFDGDDRWRELPVPAGDRYAWDPASTYVALPPFFDGPRRRAGRPRPTSSARGCWPWLGDSVTTDHISPAGSIARTSPAGEWLVEHGVEPRDFNSYGARRGHHEVMMRGTFANIRLHNLLTPDAEGNVTEHLPTRGADEHLRRRRCATPRTGRRWSCWPARSTAPARRRDWAAKGPLLLGRAGRDRRVVRADPSLEPGRDGDPAAPVPARRVGLVAGADRPRDDSRIGGIADGLRPRQEVTVTATAEDGREPRFRAVARLDGEIDVTYLPQRRRAPDGAAPPRAVRR